MYFGKPRPAVAFLGLYSLGFPLGVFTYRWHPQETPTERAHRLCDGCGLTTAELSNLIDDLRGPESRETKLRLFREQFDDAEQAELWIECGEALVDAAAVPSP